MCCRNSEPPSDKLRTLPPPALANHFQPARERNLKVNENSIERRLHAVAASLLIAGNPC
jgi:hypothetical protein